MEKTYKVKNLTERYTDRTIKLKINIKKPIQT